MKQKPPIEKPLSVDAVEEIFWKAVMDDSVVTEGFLIELDRDKQAKRRITEQFLRGLSEKVKVDGIKYYV